MKAFFFLVGVLLVVFFAGEVQSSECSSYTVLNSADRAASYRTRISKCDSPYITLGWYRFMGDAGTVIATSCVDKPHCDTTAQGWMNGSHPTQAEGIVTRTVCYHWRSNCCSFNNSIRVRNCVGFYVYELVGPSICNCRYCGSGNSMHPCNISIPCRNGGTCNNGNNDTFTCSCPSGYTGHQCETNMPCSSNPCRNGGTCDNGNNGTYTCSCPSGYTGQQCQTYMACNSNPCRNGGTCYSGNNSTYNCSCSSGYTGHHCETNMPCSSIPCRNGGTCYNGNNSTYNCSCPSEYTGHQCETNMACNSNPCRNGGTCYNGNNSTYSCSCSSGYTGQQCETRQKGTAKQQDGEENRRPTAPCDTKNDWS